MSGRLNIAAQLIKDGELEIAKQMLTKEEDSTKALYLLSLLHRYDDEYDKEKTVIDKALVLDTGNSYLRDRLAWHNLQLFDRVVPRQPLYLPRDPKTMPCKDVLEQLCFVTGADSKYFELMVECIESIQATRLYKNIPIYVLDCGLTEEEKKYLLNKLKVDRISEIGELYPNIPDGFLKNIYARPYFKQIFPGKKYYFFMDADTWIYNENCLDLYIDHAVKYGIGIARDFFASHDRLYDLHPHIPGQFYGFIGSSSDIIGNTWDEELLKKSPAVNAGIWCMNYDAPICNQWAKNMKNCITDTKLQFFTDQSALSITLGQLNIINILAHTNNYFCFMKPAYLEDKILYDIDIRAVLGIIHCAASSRRFEYYTAHAIKKNGVQVPISYRYRVWPWADKASIRQLINDQVNNILQES